VAKWVPLEASARATGEHGDGAYILYYVWFDVSGSDRQHCEIVNATERLMSAGGSTTDLPGNYLHSARKLSDDGTLPALPDSVMISTTNSRHVAEAGRDPVSQRWCFL